MNQDPRGTETAVAWSSDPQAPASRNGLIPLHWPLPSPASSLALDLCGILDAPPKLCNLPTSPIYTVPSQRRRPPHPGRPSPAAKTRGGPGCGAAQQVLRWQKRGRWAGAEGKGAALGRAGILNSLHRTAVGCYVSHSLSFK